MAKETIFTCCQAQDVHNAIVRYRKAAEKAEARGDAEKAANYRNRAEVQSARFDGMNLVLNQLGFHLTCDYDEVNDTDIVRIVKH